MDGTLSSLEEGFETNAGLVYQLLKRNAGLGVTLHYQLGLQFDLGNLLASAWSVLTGSGLDLQIQQVYGALASRYQPGDEIFLVGYSRGAFAGRSLAVLIDRAGMLRRDQATQRHPSMAYRNYWDGSVDLRAFAKNITNWMFQLRRSRFGIRSKRLGSARRGSDGFLRENTSFTIIRSAPVSEPGFKLWLWTNPRHISA